MAIIDADEVVIELLDEPNLPDTDKIAFDHREWQDNLLKTEGYKAELQRKMMEQALDAWDAAGANAFKAGLMESPLGFIRTMQNLLPKKVDVDVTAVTGGTNATLESPRVKVLKGLLEHVE